MARINASTIGFGIIGCGVIARWHVAALHEIDGVEVLGVCDARAEACERFARENNVPAFDSVEAMLAAPLIQVVTICTPSGLHAPLAMQAAEAGKHIVVEKPMALTVAEADAMIAAVARAGVNLEVISQLRFGPNVQLARRAVLEGWLGRVVSADIYMKYHRSDAYYASGSWRGTWDLDGGGALMNQGIHGVDLLQYICGPIESVFAQARTLTHKIEVEDTLAAVVNYTDGAIGVIQATTSVWPGAPRRLEISGIRGMIVLEEDSIVRWEVRDHPLPEGYSIGSATSGSAYEATAFSHEGHRRQLQAFIDCLREGSRNWVDEHEGRKAIAIIGAIYQSARTVKMVRVSTD